MKNKTILMLIELAVMLFMFIAAAALCLQGFAKAQLISKESSELNSAVLIAENAAEIMKNSCGDGQRTISILKDELGRTGFELIIDIKNESPLLGKASICVVKDQREIYSLDTAWQEG
ncbi:MAG: hypothetical protein E7623_03870 [Ruminococcaceae bacterium]|nr:hypothetical protein [Oscillospiraceae bacterium]